VSYAGISPLGKTTLAINLVIAPPVRYVTAQQFPAKGTKTETRNESVAVPVLEDRVEPVPPCAIIGAASIPLALNINWEAMP
jgi:hypothetical protein